MNGDPEKTIHVTLKFNVPVAQLQAAIDNPGSIRLRDEAHSMITARAGYTARECVDAFIARGNLPD